MFILNLSFLTQLNFPEKLMQEKRTNASLRLTKQLVIVSFNKFYKYIITKIIFYIDSNTAY